MARKCSTGKNTSGQNQPPSREVKDSLSKKPLNFPTFDPFGRYSPHIPSQSTLDPIYTSSPETPNPNPDSSLNKKLRGVTSEEPMFLIPNNEVNQLLQHTHAYLQSICQIPIIYKIPRARTSQRRTQPYDEKETIASTIDDIIIDTISEIREPIETISHSQNQEDPEFQIFLNFLEVDSTFHDFPEAKASGSGLPEPPENNHTCTNPPSPRPNFSFLSTMAGNRPWLSADVVWYPEHNIHCQNILKSFYRNLIPIMMLHLKIILNSLCFLLD